jgi:uncharacterized protein YjbI with pentapeptide repeats
LSAKNASFSNLSVRNASLFNVSIANTSIANASIVNAYIENLYTTTGRFNTLWVGNVEITQDGSPAGPAGPAGPTDFRNISSYNISSTNISCENLSAINSSFSNLSALNSSFDNVFARNVSGYNVSISNLSVLNASVTRIYAHNISGYNVSITNISATIGSFSNAVYSAAFYSTSDFTLKENIIYMNNAYDVSKLNPCTFNFINSSQKKIGFIAQDVEKIIPESVTINPLEKTLTIDYAAILSASIDSIKQIIKKMEILSSKIEKIEENIIRIDDTIEKILN